MIESSTLWVKAAELGNATQTSVNVTCAIEVLMDPQSLVTRIGIQVVLAVIMFGLGCTSDTAKMWSYVKKPQRLALGLFLQLVFFPFFGLGLSQMFGFTKAQAMGAIISSSCPGAGFSNLACFWLDGDMDLSIALTTLSTILALGTLPLWLYVLPLIINIHDECLTIPFQNLGFTILGIIVPVALGVLIKHLSAKVAKLLCKICSIVGSIFLLAFMIFLYAIVTKGLFDDPPWNVVFVASVMPLCGFVFGYLASRVPWLTVTIAARRTIAIETMMQNSGIALTIAVTSYENPFLPHIMLFIICFGTVQIALITIAVFFYLFMTWKGWCAVLLPRDTAMEKTDEKLSDDVVSKQLL